MTLTTSGRQAVIEHCQAMHRNQRGVITTVASARDKTDAAIGVNLNQRLINIAEIVGCFTCCFVVVVLLCSTLTAFAH